MKKEHRESRWVIVCLLVAILMIMSSSTYVSGAGTIWRASIASFGGQANNHSNFAVVSANGKVVAFQSYANNLVGGDLVSAQDILLHDFETERTHWISVSDTGVGGNGHSYHPTISGDGRYTAFDTQSSNFVPDTNGFFHIYLRDRQLGDTELISVSTTGTPGDGHSRNASISEDGRFVAFESTATNLVDGDTNDKKDIFVRDRVAGVTEQITITDSYWESGDCLTPAISANGRYVAFVFDKGFSYYTPVFLYDRIDQVMEMVAVNSDEQWFNGSSYNPSVSSDGRFVAFETGATNFAPGDTAEFMDIYVRDRIQGTTKRVSISTSGGNPNGSSWYPAISANGRYITFVSNANNLVVGTSESISRTYRFDTVTHATELIANVEGGGAGSESRPSISSTGHEVAFSSFLSNIVSDDTNGYWDVFLYRDPLEKFFIYLPVVSH